MALCVTASAGLAQDKDAECATQAEVAMMLVSARADGASDGDAISSVSAALSQNAQKYASIVPAMADWIYSLPEDQLTEDVRTSWVAACVAQ
jgi:hypothetical protein